MGNWLERVKGMLRLSRAERALTLAIFILFQAMLPSYAGVLSEWSGDDRLVLCTAHGLVVVDPAAGSNKIVEGGTMCLVAQSGAADLAQAPIMPALALPKLDVSALVAHQLFDYVRGTHITPHAPRGPPVLS